MGPQTDLNLFKEKAAAVQVVISEIADLPAAFDYAVDSTTKQGGTSMAAFGWEGQDRAALEDACRRAGVGLVADNLREQAADPAYRPHPGRLGYRRHRQPGAGLQLRRPAPGHHAGGNPHRGLTRLPPASRIPKLWKRN